MTEHRSPLTIEQILAWADAHRARTQRWPHALSGVIAEAPGLTWLAVDDALQQGHGGLPNGCPLAALLAQYRGRRRKPLGSPLQVGQILTWARAHQRRTGRWPTVTSGYVVDAPKEKWNAIDCALRRGVRGLPGGGSLARLLRGDPEDRNEACGARVEAGSSPRGMFHAAPEQLLSRLGDRISERRMRLFACAYVRRAWDRLSDERSRRAVEVAERFAEGAADDAELAAAHEAAAKVGTAGQPADRAAALTATPLAWRMTPIHTALALVGLLHADGEAALLGCIFGDRLGPLAPRHDGRSLLAAVEDVRELARCAYADWQRPSGTLDATHLEALADGLQQTGCAEAGLLAHLREPGPHVRGCWAVERLLAAPSQPGSGLNS